MRKLLILNLLALGALTLFTGCMGPGGSKTEKENVSIKDTETISIEADAADIEVVSEDREDISVVLHTYDRGPRLKVKDGKTVHIAAKSQMMNISFSMNHSPKLTVYVPKEYENRIEISDASGDVVVKDLKLDSFKLDLSSGDIQVSKVTYKEGSVDSSSGNITLKDVICDTTKIDSSSGNLRVEDYTGAIEGNSSSGNVLITYKEFSGDINYDTQSGDMTVDFNNQDANAVFDLSCSSGDVNVNFDLDETTKDKNNELKGTKGDGTYNVNIHASSGDITLKK